MSNYASVIALLWPASFVIALLPVFLMVIGRFREKKQTSSFAVVACLILLIMLYLFPPIRNMVRWGLSLIGFASPLALGVISIWYLVEETTEPF